MSDPTGARPPLFSGASIGENYQRRLAGVVFEPCARALTEAVQVQAGDHVLDVASGTGVVARLASRSAGPDGRVIASDISAGMLGIAASIPAMPGGAPIEYLEASALDLPVPGASIDVVLCQQGLQFFPDRSTAVREMRRVLRPGGTAAVAVWAQEFRLEPFDEYIEAAVAVGIEPPFPGAFEHATFVMEGAEVETLLHEAGFSDVTVSTVELELVWPDPQAAITGVLGTPFGPLVAALPDEQRARLYAELGRRFGTASPTRRSSHTVIGRGVAPPLDREV